MTRHRIGVISDTHGLLRPEAVQVLRNSELIIHGGNIGKATVLDALRSLAPVKAARGNVDREPWARNFPKTEAFEIDEVGVYVLHDLGEIDLMPEAARFKVVVSGHSHQPSNQERNPVPLAGQHGAPACPGRIRRGGIGDAARLTRPG